MAPRDPRHRHTVPAPLPTGYALVGDLTKGGRPATEEERVRLAGLNADGVPKGLTRCPVCAEWRGKCLDPNPVFAGQLVPVHCRCANDTRCVRCGQPLYARRLNANYYDVATGTIWHVPGFCALTHRCPVVPTP